MLKFQIISIKRCLLLTNDYSYVTLLMWVPSLLTHRQIYTQHGNKLSGKSIRELNFCLKNFSNEERGLSKDMRNPTYFL